MADFVKTEDKDFADQLAAFALGLGTYGTLLGFSPTEVTDSGDDAKLFDFLTKRQGEVQSYAQEFTRYKLLARFGRDTEALSAPIPVIAAFPTSPTITEANIESRFRKRAAKAKSATAYTSSIGESLRIVAPVEVFDPLLGVPTFKIFMDSGHPLLKWVKDKFQGVDIYKDSGTGWVKKERDLKSPWVDTDSLPAAGQSAVWKYKMIYIFDDKQTGSFSADITVTVYGYV